MELACATRKTHNTKIQFYDICKRIYLYYLINEANFCDRWLFGYIKIEIYCGLSIYHIPSMNFFSNIGDMLQGKQDIKLS